VGKEENSLCKRGPSDALRRFFTLRLLFKAYSEDKTVCYTIHFITKTIQKDMKRTLRDFDIKSCIEDLNELGFIESIPTGTGQQLYRLTEKGNIFWIEHGRYMGEFLFLGI